MGAADQPGTMPATAQVLAVRPAMPADAPRLGDIAYRAFHHIATRHGFPPDFPSPEVAAAGLGQLIAHPRFAGRVAELGGRPVGSNFLDERGPIAGVGPITVDPEVQDAGVGRRLMAAVLDRAEERDAAGVRLVQAAYHMRSLGLYSKLGFQARELLVCLQGPAIARAMRGRAVRLAKPADAAAADELAIRAHGHHRGGEVRDAIRAGSALVVEHGGVVTGYATGVGFGHHMVGEGNPDLQALLGAGRAIEGPGVLVPARNRELLAWALDQGWRGTQGMTLMSKGLYNEPARPFVPSIYY